MALYDPILREIVMPVAKLPDTDTMYSGFGGEKTKAANGTKFQWLRCLRLDGTTRDYNLNDLRADNGSVEIMKAHNDAPTST